MIKLEQIDHVALTVSNPLKSAAWYHAVLGLERRQEDAWGDYPIMMSLGSTSIALFPSLITVPSDPPDKNETVMMRHLAFRTDWQNFQAAKEELQKHGVDFLFEDHKIAHSLYFIDPDGHQLEITTYDLATAG